MHALLIYVDLREKGGYRGPVAADYITTLRAACRPEGLAQSLADSLVAWAVPSAKEESTLRQLVALVAPELRRGGDSGRGFIADVRICAQELRWQRRAQQLQTLCRQHLGSESQDILASLFHVAQLRRKEGLGADSCARLDLDELLARGLALTADGQEVLRHLALLGPAYACWCTAENYWEMRLAETRQCPIVRRHVLPRFQRFAQHSPAIARASQGTSTSVSAELSPTVQCAGFLARRWQGSFFRLTDLTDSCPLPIKCSTEHSQAD